MANIKISEQDLTSAGSTNTTENYAYVPGYAIMGPINEPTVCETLSDFQRIFGSVPYRFKNQQSYQTITFAQANDYEKSYIYASELLRAGLPIVFERVFTLFSFGLKEKTYTLMNICIIKCSHPPKHASKSQMNISI